MTMRQPNKSGLYMLWHCYRLRTQVQTTYLPPYEPYEPYASHVLRDILISTTYTYLGSYAGCNPTSSHPCLTQVHFMSHMQVMSSFSSKRQSDRGERSRSGQGSCHVMSCHVVSWHCDLVNRHKPRQGQEYIDSLQYCIYLAYIPGRD
jgi:hypothetical protein